MENCQNHAFSGPSLLVVMLLGSDPARHQVVLHRVGQGEVVVPLSGDMSVLDDGVVCSYIYFNINVPYRLQYYIIVINHMLTS